MSLTPHRPWQRRRGDGVVLGGAVPVLLVRQEPAHLLDVEEAPELGRAGVEGVEVEAVGPEPQHAAPVDGRHGHGLAVDQGDIRVAVGGEL
ncbi:MAG: hypothetical protein IPG97_16445 [Microthrixaceae bacterium]|nr:hypothetical protein [Microthrixaceae bacterium]